MAVDTARHHAVTLSVIHRHATRPTRARVPVRRRCRAGVRPGIRPAPEQTHAAPIGVDEPAVQMRALERFPETVDELIHRLFWPACTSRVGCHAKRSSQRVLGDEHREPLLIEVTNGNELLEQRADRRCERERRTKLRISVSLTTNREDVRRLYEPHCPPMSQRLEAMRRLRAAGLEVHATLAPLLPCDPEVLAGLALDVTDRDIIADPFHTRTARAHGAITREAAHRISASTGFGAWHDPSFQADVIDRLRRTVEAAGRQLGVGTTGFAWLAA